jgi:D-alanine-D-alanine ligase
MHELTFREEVREPDIGAVREIVTATKMFYHHEAEVAAELVEERLRRGPTSGYSFVFAEIHGEVVGYSCYGPIACTTHSYDLFWIAVHPNCQGHGIGKQLLAISEQRIAESGGKRIYVETSGRELYHPTRAFYERCAYTLEATLRDFYAPGDDKTVYVKVVSPNS